MYGFISLAAGLWLVHGILKKILALIERATRTSRTDEGLTRVPLAAGYAKSLLSSILQETRTQIETANTYAYLYSAVLLSRIEGVHKDSAVFYFFSGKFPHNNDQGWREGFRGAFAHG